MRIFFQLFMIIFLFQPLLLPFDHHLSPIGMNGDNLMDDEKVFEHHREKFIDRFTEFSSDLELFDEFITSLDFLDYKLRLCLIYKNPSFDPNKNIFREYFSKESDIIDSLNLTLLTENYLECLENFTRLFYQFTNIRSKDSEAVPYSSNKIHKNINFDDPSFFHSLSSNFNAKNSDEIENILNSLVAVKAFVIEYFVKKNDFDKKKQLQNSLNDLMNVLHNIYAIKSLEEKLKKLSSIIEKNKNDELKSAIFSNKLESLLGLIKEEPLIDSGSYDQKRAELTYSLILFREDFHKNNDLMMSDFKLNNASHILSQISGISFQFIDFFLDLVETDILKATAQCILKPERINRFFEMKYIDPNDIIETITAEEIKILFPNIEHYDKNLQFLIARKLSEKIIENYNQFQNNTRDFFNYSKISKDNVNELGKKIRLLNDRTSQTIINILDRIAHNYEQLESFYKEKAQLKESKIIQFENDMIKQLLKKTFFYDETFQKNIKGQESLLTPHGLKKAYDDFISMDSPSEILKSFDRFMNMELCADYMLSLLDTIEQCPFEFMIDESSNIRFINSSIEFICLKNIHDLIYTSKIKINENLLIPEDLNMKLKNKPEEKNKFDFLNETLSLWLDEQELYDTDKTIIFLEIFTYSTLIQINGMIEKGCDLKMQRINQSILFLNRIVEKKFNTQNLQMTYIEFFYSVIKTYPSELFPLVDSEIERTDYFEHFIKEFSQGRYKYDKTLNEFQFLNPQILYLAQRYIENKKIITENIFMKVFKFKGIADMKDETFNEIDRFISDVIEMSEKETGKPFALMKKEFEKFRQIFSSLKKELEENIVQNLRYKSNCYYNFVELMFDAIKFFPNSLQESISFYMERKQEHITPVESIKLYEQIVAIMNDLNEDQKEIIIDQINELNKQVNSEEYMNLLELKMKSSESIEYYYSSLITLLNDNPCLFDRSA